MDSEILFVCCRCDKTYYRDYSGRVVASIAMGGWVCGSCLDDLSKQDGGKVAVVVRDRLGRVFEMETK